MFFEHSKRGLVYASNMKSNRPFLAFGCLISLAGFLYAEAPEQAASSPAPKITVDASEAPRFTAFPSFAPIVEKVAPSIVSVYTSKTVHRPAMPPEWKRFFGGGDDQGSGTVEGLGSGVIVSPDGYILTNNHVIEGADEIFVSIGLKRKEYKAKKIGADAGTDIAVLKIESKDLPSITFADSDKARVGDVVLAVGNPFGLTESVTSGIISGLGRGMGIADYENFIQTDASINPGNSGGALVDTEGRLVGINTAIFSHSGGNQGIGFAVPSNLAHLVMQSLREHGKVVRGFLGTLIQPLTPELADAFKLKEVSGALISQVTGGSPAEKAGLKSGDIITAVNGKQIDDARSLRVTIASMSPGTKVDVAYLREGKADTVQAILGQLPEKKPDGSSTESPGENVSNILDGITVGDITDEARKTLQIPSKIHGALITDIDKESAGYTAGLREGMVVEELDQQPIKDSEQAVHLSEKIQKDEKVLLRVWDAKEGSHYVALEKK